MDDTRAAQIRARLDAATDGPWMIASDPPYPQRIVANDDGLVLIAETYSDPTWLPADADLIAHAPTDLADLLDEREKLLAVVEAACRHEDTRERYQAEPGDSAPLYVEFIKAGGDLTAAVRAYRAATTGDES